MKHILKLFLILVTLILVITSCEKANTTTTNDTTSNRIPVDSLVLIDYFPYSVIVTDSSDSGGTIWVITNLGAATLVNYDTNPNDWENDTLAMSAANTVATGSNGLMYNIAAVDSFTVIGGFTATGGGVDQYQIPDSASLKSFLATHYAMLDLNGGYRVNTVTQVYDAAHDDYINQYNITDIASPTYFWAYDDKTVTAWTVSNTGIIAKYSGANQITGAYIILKD